MKSVKCSDSGLRIPKITSMIVTRDNIPKTFQILPVFDTYSCSCDIIKTFEN
jgi:hypothetical protein